MFDNYAESGIGDGKIIFAEIAAADCFPGCCLFFTINAKTL